MRTGFKRLRIKAKKIKHRVFPCTAISDREKAARKRFRKLLEKQAAKNKPVLESCKK